MKTFIILFSLVSTSVMAKSITLNCEDNTVIKGVGTSKITLAYNADAVNGYEIEKTVDGDCHGRTFFDCYQDGQLMVNIPKSLSTGKKTVGRVWINEDADDNTSNGRLGSPSNCQVR